MIEQRMELCRKAGVRSHVSYEVKKTGGKPADEIVKLSGETNIDLIVMASSRITPPVRLIGSTIRKVIDSVKGPVLFIHE